MNPTIFNMREIAAHDAAAEVAADSVIDKLVDGLLSLPESSPAELSDELRDRADAYDASQPSYAADLRAAVAAEGTEAQA